MPWTDDDNGVDPEWQGDVGSGTVVMGGTKLEQLANVSVPSGEADNLSTIIYDSNTKLWTPTLLDVVSGVLSFNGRAGIVLPQAGDYIFDQLGDVNLAGLANGQFISWNETAGEWQPVEPPGGAVDSVFGRQGNVVALLGDYSADLVTYTPSGDLTATETQGAIDELEANKIATGDPIPPSDVAAETVPTSLISGGEITEIPADPLNVTVAGGTGVVVNAYDDYANATFQDVSWIGQVVPLLNPGTEQRTYFRVDNTGTILTSNNPITPSGERTSIYLGFAYHDPLGVDPPKIFNSPSRSGHTAHGLLDMIDFVGPLLKGFTPVPNADLTFGNSGGEYFDMGVNYLADPSDPNRLVLPPAGVLEFYYFTGDGTLQPGGLQTNVDVGNYDPGGVGPAPIAVPGAATRATIQYYFGIVPGTGAMLYGQNWYDTLEIAKDKLLDDRNSLVIPEELESAVGPLYAIVATAGATNLSDPAEAELFNVIDSGFGGGSGGGGTPAPVTSVFGRIGDVVGVLNDYSADLIQFDPTGLVVIAANEVQTGMAELDAAIAAIPPSKTDLNSLDDVIITAPANNNVLRYNGSEWINSINFASNVTSTPIGAVSATNVDAAIAELEGISAVNTANIAINAGDIAALDAIKPDSDPTGITGAAAVANIVSISQADYDAIGTPDAATLYLITG